MALAKGYIKNFETLKRAFLMGEAALIDCQQTDTGKTVAVICAVNKLPDGSFEFVPFATMFSDDPYREVNPPNPDGGFRSQEESHG